ncbi:hypothetical protein ACVWWO_003560 [Bradyrhizobium sp. F1.13.1]
MDVTTTRTVQKLGRMSPRLDEALTAAVALPNRVDGSLWSPTFSPVGKPYSGYANVEGNALSYSYGAEGRGLERRGSFSPKGPSADRSSGISIRSPAAIIEQLSYDLDVDAENQPVSSQGVRDADMSLLPTGAVVPLARIRLL